MFKNNKLYTERIINSLKGISGSGRLLGDFIRKATDILLLDPGDYATKTHHISAPLAIDLWYLNNAVNLITYIDADTDTETFVSENLKFLEDKLEGLKPLKEVTIDSIKATTVETAKLADPPSAPRHLMDEVPPDMPLPDPYMDLQQLRAYLQSVIAWAQTCKEIQVSNRTSFRVEKSLWSNQGDYFINVAPYEIKHPEFLFTFDTEDIDTDNLAGCLLFPVGQLGVMEMISYFQETWTEEDDFALDAGGEAIHVVEDPEMFPPISEIELDKSYGEILIRNGYLIPEDKQEVFEYLQKEENLTVADYPEDIAPKTWARLWITREDEMPVPGEFIGILIKPILVPPHVWWFQETAPFIYAGNWVETQNLTSGVITSVTLEADRTDGEIGNEYKVKVNGTEITAYASDFKLYAVNDRVAILKRWTTAEAATKAFTWLDQKNGTHPVKDEKSYEFVILPITFYKES